MKIIRYPQGYHSPGRIIMTRKKVGPVQSIMQSIAASKPGSWFFARTLHHFDRFFLWISGGRITMSTILAGLPELNLTTTGAKSGLARSIPLIYIRDETNPGTFALIASNWGQKRYPSWYFNLKANPQATAVIAGKSGEYVAREASGDEYERFWQQAVDTYAGYPNYKERIHGGRSIPIMVLSPKTD